MGLGSKGSLRPDTCYSIAPNLREYKTHAPFFLPGYPYIEHDALPTRLVEQLIVENLLGGQRLVTGSGAAITYTSEQVLLLGRSHVRCVADGYFLNSVPDTIKILGSERDFRIRLSKLSRSIPNSYAAYTRVRFPVHVLVAVHRSGDTTRKHRIDERRAKAYISSTPITTGYGSKRPHRLLLA